jgi:hypothetical protein
MALRWRARCACAQGLCGARRRVLRLTPRAHAQGAVRSTPCSCAHTAASHTHAHAPLSPSHTHLHLPHPAAHVLELARHRERHAAAAAHQDAGVVGVDRGARRDRRAACVRACVLGACRMRRCVWRCGCVRGLAALRHQPCPACAGAHTASSHHRHSSPLLHALLLLLLLLLRGRHCRAQRCGPSCSMGNGSAAVRHTRVRGARCDSARASGFACVSRSATRGCMHAVCCIQACTTLLLQCTQPHWAARPELDRGRARDAHSHLPPAAPPGRALSILCCSEEAAGTANRVSGGWWGAGAA